MLVDMESTVSVLENKCDFVYNVYVARNCLYPCIIELNILCDFSCNVDLGNVIMLMIMCIEVVWRHWAPRQLKTFEQAL